MVTPLTKLDCAMWLINQGYPATAVECIREAEKLLLKQIEAERTVETRAVHEAAVAELEATGHQRIA